MRQPLLLIGAILVVLLGAAGFAFGDGKVFKVLAEDPSGAHMPDQQALIYFKDGVETLAIETRFEGNPANFAWVVPLPAAPEVTPAPRGVFKTLRAMHQPEIRGNYQSWMLLWVPVLIAVLTVMARPRWYMGVVLGGFAMVVAVGVLLPSLGVKRSIDPGFEGVSELSRELVGDFEVGVVESKDPAALVKWLKGHNFDVPQSAERVIAEYVADGWVFATAKMRRDATAKGGGPVTPHPLVFKFPVKSPVYPMRLTGVENGGPLKVDLYVLADGRAEAPGFSVERCGSTRLRESEYEGHWSRTLGRAGTDVIVSHSWLRSAAPGAAVSTKLSGTLAPAAMVRDVNITLAPLKEHRPRLWANEAALERALDVGLGVCTIGLIGVGLVAMGRKWKSALRAGPLAGVVLAALVAGGAAYGLTDRAGATKRARDLLVHGMADDVWEACEARVKRGEVIDEAWLRSVTQEYAQSAAFERDGDLSAMPIEEDSPGNYVFRRDGEAWVYVWYDYYGNENARPLEFE